MRRLKDLLQKHILEHCIEILLMIIYVCLEQQTAGRSQTSWLRFEMSPHPITSRVSAVSKYSVVQIHIDIPVLSYYGRSWMNVRECIVESRKSLFAVIEIRKRDYRLSETSLVRFCHRSTSLYIALHIAIGIRRWHQNWCHWACPVYESRY